MKHQFLLIPALTALAILTAAPSSYSAEEDLAPIKAEVAKRHEEAMRRRACRK